MGRRREASRSVESSALERILQKSNDCHYGSPVATGGLERLKILTDQHLRLIFVAFITVISEMIDPAFIRANPTDKLIAVVCQQIDLRMTVQQVFFTIHGSKGPMEDRPEAAQFLVVQFLIPKDAKATLRQELMLLGIRRLALFPDLGNLATDLASVDFYRKM